MNDNKYTKLSELVGKTFRVEQVGGYQFKKWSVEDKHMLTSDKWQEGYRKLYAVTTDKGLLDMSGAQIGQMLEGVVKNGRADLIDKTFQVKSNGKEGIEIRYFINFVPTHNETLDDVYDPES